MKTASGPGSSPEELHTSGTSAGVKVEGNRKKLFEKVYTVLVYCLTKRTKQNTITGLQRE